MKTRAFLVIFLFLDIEINLHKMYKLGNLSYLNIDILVSLENISFIMTIARVKDINWKFGVKAILRVYLHQASASMPNLFDEKLGCVGYYCSIYT